MDNPLPYKPVSKESLRGWFLKNAVGGRYAFIIERESDSRMLGYVGLKYIDAERRVAELFIVIGEIDQWEKDTAKRATA